MRAGAYSPNHIGNDAAIFNAVVENLRKRGCIVNIYSEDQFIAGNVTENIIVNMCREQKSIALLQKMEDEGRLVINSGYGIENCTRERMTRILIGSNIPYPESLMVNTNEGRGLVGLDPILAEWANTYPRTKNMEAVNAPLKGGENT